MSKFAAQAGRGSNTITITIIMMAMQAGIEEEAANVM